MKESPSKEAIGKLRRKPRKLGANSVADFDSRRTMILDKAMELFAERGFTNVSIDQIADALGVTKPTIYHYFKSKDKIVEGIIIYGRSYMWLFLDKVEAEDCSRFHALKSFFFFYGSTTSTPIGKVLLRIDWNTLGDDVDSLIREYGDELYKRVEAIVSAGIEEGSIRECDPFVVARSLCGSLGYMAKWFEPDYSRTTSLVLSDMWLIYERALKIDGFKMPDPASLASS